MDFNKVISRLITLSILVTLACNNAPGEARNPATPSGQAILVFLDISNSITNQAFVTAIKKLEEIYFEIPNKPCIIQVYPLYGKTGQFTPPMAKIKLERNPYSGNVEMQNIFERNKRNLWFRYKEQIIAQRQEYFYKYSGGGPLNSSCILKSLSDANQFFSKFKFQRKRLIYISDMLEDCARTGIDFDQSSQAFTSAPALALENIAPDSFLNDVEISILIPVTPNFPNWIDNDNLIGFWRSIFSRVGMNGSMKINYEIIAHN